MTLLALVALVASALVWAAPSSQAQANQAPFADAGRDQTLNPGDTASLTTTSFDVDGTVTRYEWEVETGPYDWIRIGEDATTATDDTETPDAAFDVPSEAFVDKVSDSDPQKYEIVVRLTVTDDKGASDSDTVSININQRPVANIQVYAGLQDEDIVDADLGARGHFPIDAVIDGPGENGNRDNEWDIMEGAYLQLDGSGSTDEGPSGSPSVYQWTRVRPTGDLPGYSTGNDTATSAQQRLTVANANPVTITFDGVDEDGTPGDDTLTVNTLPGVDPNVPQTVFYRLTVCDKVGTNNAPTEIAAFGADITESGETNCTGRKGATLIRIVVHDTSSAPEVDISAGLTVASTNRRDAAPQATIGAITGVENQFIVAAGSTVLLTAEVEDDDQTPMIDNQDNLDPRDDFVSAHSNHRFRWSGAVGGAHSAPGGGTAGDDDVNTASMATVRIPADADDGDTIDVSVTVTDDTRISVTTEIQLLVGENAQPTASGVRGTDPDGDGPSPKLLRINDGFQNQKDGSTVTIRGVGYDADGESLLYNWSEIDLATQEPDEDPKLELQGSFTDTVSFEVPELESGGENLTVFLNMTVIDPNGAFATDGVLITIVNDDDAPDADAGDDEQVDPEDFVRLNGSGSSDADIGDKISYRWDYLGATMDPAPDERSPLSADEIDELKGWILPQDFTGTTVETSDYIVTGGGQLKDGVTGLTNLKSTSSPYPYFDAPDLTGFNNIKLTFRLHVKDSGGTDIDGDDATTTADVTSLDEADVDADLDGNGDKDGTEIAMVKESILGLDLNNDGDAEDEINLGASNCGADGESSCAANEANVAAVDSDMVTITVVNRFFSGNISGPGSCTEMSLGGPQTYAFDSDDDGVADICALNTTRRATVARQNALETLAGLNPVEFRTEVLAVCGEAGFKQKDYDDDPSDLETDVCETERVTPPPAAADPATADVFFSGTVTGLDYCTNHSLGGARLYAFDSDGDGVADVCSLPTTRREAIARQSALETFISAPFTNQTELDFLKYLAYIHDLGADRNDAQDAEYAKFAGEFEDGLASHNIAGITQDDSLNPEELGHLNGTVDLYEDQKSRAGRYSNALAAACRALGSQDFGDSASALARDECVPTPTTGEPLG